MKKESANNLFFVVLLVLTLAAPVTWAGTAKGASPLSLTILHVNDTHTHLLAEGASFDFEGVKTYCDLGGYARLAAAVKQVRTQAGPVLLLHAGDAIQGSLFGLMTKGKSAIDFLNYMNFDAMTVGNHEFDFGPQVLSMRIQEAKFPVLGANVDASRDENLKGLIAPFVIKEVDGQKVGLIGLVTPETAHASQPGKDVDFSDAAAAAEKYIAELTGQGIDKIILLTHLGYSEDLKLAQSVKGVDVIVGGHSHTLLGRENLFLNTKPEGPYPTVVEGDGKVCVVQAWSYDRALGILQVSFDDQGRVTQCQGGAPILVDHFKQKDSAGEKVPVDDKTQKAIMAKAAEAPMDVRVVADDADTAAHLQPYVENVQALMKENIGRAAVDLTGGSQYRVPKAKSESGSPEGSQVAGLVCASMLKKVRDNHFDVPIALLNAGGIRISIPQGDIKVADAYNVLPFGNTLVLLQLTGQELKTTLENALKMATKPDNPSTGAFPYLAGARYAAQGDQVTLLEYQAPDGTWQAVAPDKVYKLVVNSFIAHGGDQYQMLADAAASQLDTGFVDNTVLIDYIKEKKVLEPVPTNVNYNGLNPF